MRTAIGHLPLVALTLLSLAVGPVAAQQPSLDERMGWWREARFGMFIHWGLYAIPAGDWNGKPVQGTGEWILGNSRAPLEEYEALATRFNPTKYDPAAWVAAAKAAGMKYLVITSKHHDGFALFDSKAGDWDVVDRTPWKRDLLKPLADECRKQGVKFCIYHSILDWRHPTQQRVDDPGHTNMRPGRKAEYVAFMKQQLGEMIDMYDPEVLWFDGEWVSWWTEPDGKDLYAFLMKKKPTLIVNNRVGKGRAGMSGLDAEGQDFAGDFGTPEQEVPATGLPGVDWESCVTMNDTWGFKTSDHNWKSSEQLTRMLVDIASKGGNFLLNVGPTAAGEIPPESLERLAAMGDWMKVNGESIYGTSASPVGQPAWGRVTSKRSGDTTTLYLHVFDWPAEGKLVVPMGAERQFSEALSAELLADRGAGVTPELGPDGLTVNLPATAPDPTCSVVAVTLRETASDATR
ncbi:MAG: alpha-L-fucosidase [Lacipirellulaceae bacterium]